VTSFTIYECSQQCQKESVYSVLYFKFLNFKLLKKIVEIIFVNVPVSTWTFMATLILVAMVQEFIFR